MADNRNFAALDWVVGEIGETLKQARQSLEAYVEDPQDSTRIRFCLTHIHQVHGSLQMIEFFGAALLAEEMESIAQALMNNDVKNQGEAHEVLMRAILQLPIYLEQVKARRNDDPASLLPLLNDLRAARGSSLLSESQFFNPDISAAKTITGKKNPAQENAAQFKAVVAKLRQMYQYAAAGVIKGVKVDENLQYLQKVFTRLDTLTSGTARQPLWDIALALVEGIGSEDIQVSVSLKELLRQLDKEIRLLAEHGVKALDTFTRAELIKNLLYYVANSDAHTPRIERLRREFSLDTALPGQTPIEDSHDMLSGPDPETMRTVVNALNDELASIKSALDVSISGADDMAVAEALPVMKRVADTLAVLGVADLRKQILVQADSLELASQNGDVPNDTLMAVADEILAIEQRLEVLANAASTGEPQTSQQVQIDQAQESVLREARNGLEQAKDAIIEYIASQWERSHLTNVPKLLEDIRGGLAIIPLPRPAEILHGCSRYIENELLAHDASPEWSALDTLADAIASVEYFLERLSGDRDEDDEVLLSLAEESIESLGYGPNGTGQKTSDGAHAQADAESVLGKIGTIESVSIEALPQESSAPDVHTLNEQPPFVEQAEDESVITADEPESVADSHDIDNDGFSVASSSDLAASDIMSSAQPAPTLDADNSSAESAASGAVEPVEGSRENDDIDEEIIEIFIEEAGEVLEAIDEFLPQWASDFDNDSALTEFRRAFHTLKGSGRMVGANDVGELAWSVESMLNRVLERSIKPHPVQVALISRVRAVLPEFIEAFEHNRPNPNPQLAQQLSSWADDIIRGELPAPLLDADAAGVVPQGVDQISDSVAESDDSLSDGAFGESSDDDENNAVLWEIFGTEAITHLQVVELFIEEMEDAAPLYTPPSEGMQRALHTLKGSAHMADVHDIAELATPLERFAKELRTYQVNIDEDILQLFKDGAAYTHGALAKIRAGEIVSITKLNQFLARVAELRDLSVGPLIRQQEESRAQAVDPELLSIFMAEEMNLLLDADELIDRWRHQPTQLDKIDALNTELNTLAKGAEHANLPPMAAISHQLCAVYSAANDDLSTIGDDGFETLLAAHENLLDMVDAVAAGQNLRPINDGLEQQLESLVQRLLASPATVTAESISDDVESIQDDVVSAIDVVSSIEVDESSIEVDDTANSDDSLLNAEDFGELDGAIEVIDVANASDLDADIAAGFLDAVGEDFDVLASVTIDLDEPASHDLSASADDEQVQLQDAEHDIDASVFGHQVEEVVEAEESFQLPPVAPSSVAIDDASDDTDDDIDPEIIEIFLEEADELLEDIEQSVHRWSQDWDSQEAAEELKRALHTLKGGARLSGMTTVGNVAHDFETDVISAHENHGISDDFFTKVNAYQDQLLKGIEAVKAGMAGDTNLSQALNVVTEPVSAHSTDEVHKVAVDETGDQENTAQTRDDGTGASPLVGQTQPADQSGADILPFIPKDNIPVVSSGDTFDVSPAATAVAPGNSGGVSASPLQARRSAPQEVVKVSAELLEELVNLAGETSISRGRMEEQVSELGFAIDEMDSTIARLQEQLRRLDIETQAQILFRQEQMAESEEFDPLEMDRYSQLQQLSRSLIESASDLMDLKSTLSDKTRDTETLLLQQSRINTDLQEGLMRSRMVPFARLVPRLRRIVRQISGELDKRVNFELDNVEGELDRTVLERMVAPLEHMLRNAVDHGIETPQERIDAGKPESGRIVLTLGREGSDVMLRLLDDGRGINLERVRAKAIERGLMSAEAKLSDRDVMQFILHAGFSTAESVTQISGRGVGMDVVHSEIKQLGGAMSINSRWGEGTEFTIRLPFTVSVNRALMVRIGDDRYAVPLNTIEGIVRVSPFELEHYYQDEQARFEYAGEQYKVRYLGNLLNSDARPKLEGQAMPLPVVLVRTAQNAVAMQVDMLMGSREVVVKSLGAQFAGVQGVSGATVMGDGSVVVILDPHAMIRQEAALLHNSGTLLDIGAEPTTIDEQARTIMVVDDSVTVRKVTSRFLEREGYEVLTAKDGADALLLLQDHIPDAMLLDIEMPRMDGFEVAKNVRSSSRLKDIPIIMITSRTGDKHRERALSLGVDKYMGKPYQEDKLLHNIRVVTGEQDDDLEDDSLFEE